MIKSFFRKFNKSLFYLKYNFKRQLRIFFKIDQIIYIGNKKIILPPGHLLSLYESVYPKYDRFLPTVIGKIKENEVIIDIGANIGDTLFRLLNINTRPYYYCIEADNFFFEYLQKNKKSLDVNIQNKIILIKTLVGDQLQGNLSETTTGTKSLIESDLGIKSKKYHRELFNFINKSDIKKCIFICDKNDEIYYADYLKKSTKFLFFNEIDRVGETINKYTKSGDFILIKGSRRWQLERVIKSID